MAHIKTGGTTKGNRDSRSKRLGVKAYGGERVVNGNILIRQRGSRVHAGEGTRIGRDFTIYAVRDGVVKFSSRMGTSCIVVVNA